MATKMYDLTGVSTNIELGKNGYQVQYDSVNGWVEILQADGSTLGKLQVAEPTANSDASTKLYVDTSINNLIDSAPGTMDTLNEIAAALNDDPDFYTTITGLINDKADSSVVTEIDANVDDVITLTGIAENTTTLGTGFTYITDNSSMLTAFQELDTQISTNATDISNMDRGCRHTTITSASGSSANIGGTIPADRVIKKAFVKVTQAWDGASSTMSLGKTGATAELAATSTIDLTTIGIYEITDIVQTGGSTYQVLATMNQDSSTTGSAFVLVEFC